ncbi:ArsI/CadI family heavy metal resistance metalloenzyme [Acidithiobacillus thiooxidans]|uniref:Glyoxalase n=1 Tax=Acidithiobacillus thiooxidans TaxID=930 RepID=A0A1C2JCN8_ACITH|nr:ArsI/CadI family heavy metal resistance metalloenzyme [Acidithiobacillus thiooxidans]MDR7928327.1 ArsI/CadI family heavy metal resistance metalloenzyme [Acidithiobacillus thiooxidans]OCX71493.1 glyoxalase [Acidithiobacillus thiooxidans]OCX85964.1 glyoxalase [Acidithiobacillus thiooxidans]
MKRFHVHVAVNDLTASIAFYSKLFGQAPSKEQPDYAKWMLEDPRLNFAISSRGHAIGVNHFGMQADSTEELAGLKVLADDASGGTTLDQGETACCYAKSEKHWTVDPQGLAWEHFLTMSDAVAFGEDTATQTGACCIPPHSSEGAAKQEPCCTPQKTVPDQQQQCCR